MYTHILRMWGKRFTKTCFQWAAVPIIKYLLCIVSTICRWGEQKTTKERACFKILWYLSSLLRPDIRTYSKGDVDRFSRGFEYVQRIEPVSKLLVRTHYLLGDIDIGRSHAYVKSVAFSRKYWTMCEMSNKCICVSVRHFI